MILDLSKIGILESNRIWVIWALKKKTFEWCHWIFLSKYVRQTHTSNLYSRKSLWKGIVFKLLELKTIFFFDLDVSKNVLTRMQYLNIKLSTKENSGNILFSFSDLWFIRKWQWSIGLHFFLETNRKIIFVRCVNYDLTKLLSFKNKTKTKKTFKKVIFFMRCEL